MSYRPHKRKKATTLEGKCVERIVRNFRDIFRPGVLSVALRTQVLELLCDDPILVSLPEGAPILSSSQLLFLPPAADIHHASRGEGMSLPFPPCLTRHHDRLPR